MSVHIADPINFEGAEEKAKTIFCLSSFRAKIFKFLRGYLKKPCLFLINFFLMYLVPLHVVILR